MSGDLPRIKTMPAESRNYYQQNHVNQIMESIMTGLTVVQPTDPVQFIEGNKVIS